MGRLWRRYGLRGSMAVASTAAVILGASGWSVAKGPVRDGGDKREGAVCVERRPAAGGDGAQSRCGVQSEAHYDASFSPQRLSRSEQTPISLRAAMRFETSDGSPPPALQEFDISEDRHARLNLKDVPACPQGTVESPPIEQRCKDAVIGSGKMIVNIHFPEAPPIETQSELTAFNGGLREDARTLLIVGDIDVPTPTQIVSTVLVKRSKPGRYKLELVGSMPKIAGGAGSATYLGLRFRKGVFSASCKDRHLSTGFASAFADGTRLSGTVSRPCAPSS